MKYKYCPYCAGKLKSHKEYFACVGCGNKIYINSKPAAGIVIIENGKFLITKRAIDPMKGHYDVIGGFLQKGEHPTKGAIREAKEETGADVRIIKQLGIYIDRDYVYQGEKIHIMIVLYLAEILKGKMKPKDDAASLHWFPIGKPPKKLAFPWLTKAMKDLEKETVKTG